MAAPGKPHRAEAWEREQIARASSFTATLFNGRGNRWRQDCATLAEARAVAADLEAQHATRGRRALVYAVVPGLGGILVPADYELPGPDPAP